MAYLFTRFPHLTETFLQREVLAMKQLGLEPVLFSLHRGGGVFAGTTVRTFNKWRLLQLFWLAFVECLRGPHALAGVARRLFLTWPRDWINYWENLYGAGIGVVLAREIRSGNFQHAHSVWASLPATTAWVLSRLTGVTFSIGAHAYDLFEHGGDWLLREKCAASSFVHTSTESGFRRLLALGVPASKIVLARRGLLPFPPCRPLRADRSRLRVLCIARLVEKKGLLRQLAIYDELRARGLAFEVRIVGEGPMRRRLATEIAARQLDGVVALAGRKSIDEVWAELAAADVLVHSGVVAGSGDRDGLPNVVPEAMAAGVLVVTAPCAGVQEAIVHKETGFVCALDDAGSWRDAFDRLQNDTVVAERIRQAARAWTEEHFDAVKNARLVLARFERVRHERALADAPALPPSDDAVV
ncbi:MAG: glycosyltransferase [Opitutaceae bacterium]